jgi:hypothetical protein
MAKDFISDYDPRWDCAILYWNNRMGQSHFVLLDSTTSKGQMQLAFHTCQPISIPLWIWKPIDWRPGPTH